jgi:hypothetical protein
VSSGAQPRRRRSEAKRLPAKFIRGNEKNVHPVLCKPIAILTRISHEVLRS